MTLRSLAKLLLFAAILSASLAASSPSDRSAGAPQDYGPWLPRDANANGAEIDNLFYLILYITGFFFVVTELAMLAFVIVFRKREGAKSRFVHGNRPLEIVWTLVPAAILVWLALYQKGVWEKHKINFPNENDKNVTLIEVTAEQFKWIIRYPGADRKFGLTRPELAEPKENPLGVDWKDPAAQDDIVVANTLHAPVNKPVLVKLRSRDVLHSFFIPVMRVKQDAVPGLKNNRVWFLPDETCRRYKTDERGNRVADPAGTDPKQDVDDWEIACAELCGNLHYTMRGYVRIESEDAYQKWLEYMDKTMTRGEEE